MLINKIKIVIWWIADDLEKIKESDQVSRGVNANLNREGGC